MATPTSLDGMLMVDYVFAWQGVHARLLASDVATLGAEGPSACLIKL